MSINTTYWKIGSLLAFPQSAFQLRQEVASLQQGAAHGNHRGSQRSTLQTSPESCRDT